MEALREGMEGKSTWELREELVLSSEPVMNVFAPRIYVTLTQRVGDSAVDAHGVVRPAQITFGPYVGVELSDGRMYATDREAERFCLATEAAGGWKLQDGLDEATPTYAKVRFHTWKPPAPPPAAREAEEAGEDEGPDIGGEG